ncbi:hypothetical protein [Lentzea sp. NPDC055074]
MVHEFRRQQAGVEAVVRLICCLAILLLAACTSPVPTPPAPSGTAQSSAAPAFGAPTWTRHTAESLPYERLEQVDGGAGWKAGFVVVGSYTRPAAPNSRGVQNDIFPALHTSADGENWREVTALAGVRQFAWGGAAAGHGDHGYVLGNGNQGPTVLTSDGGVWSRMPLPDARVSEEGTSISAGPRGVVVVAFGKRSQVDGLRVWHSSDGVTFGKPVLVPVPGLYTSERPVVVATDRGFLIHRFSGTGNPNSVLLFESADGRTWTDVSAQIRTPPNLRFSALYAAQHNGAVTVVFGRLFSTVENQAVDGEGLAAYYRRDGDMTWTEASVEPGRMPDAGVVPRVERDVYQVVPWQQGFMALGATGALAVWTSEDGAKWKKTPVRENGFDQVQRMRYLTDGGLGLMLTAGHHNRSGPTWFWRTGEASPRSTENQPAPQGGSWSQHAGSFNLDDNGDGELRYQVAGVDGIAAYRSVKVKHIRATAHGTRTMEITASDDPEAPKGAQISAKVIAPGAVLQFPGGRQTEFCDSTHYGECGA